MYSGGSVNLALFPIPTLASDSVLWILAGLLTSVSFVFSFLLLWVFIPTFFLIFLTWRCGAVQSEGREPRVFYPDAGFRSRSVDLGGVADVCVLCFLISFPSGLYSHFFSHILNLAVRCSERGGSLEFPQFSWVDLWSGERGRRVYHLVALGGEAMG